MQSFLCERLICVSFSVLEKKIYIYIVGIEKRGVG